MSRTYRLVLLVPAILVVLNALALLAAGGPCMPGDAGCS